MVTASTTAAEKLGKAVEGGAGGGGLWMRVS
jgi:hypothetical protein